MKCAHCPVAAGEACLGETVDAPYLCPWAATGDATKRAHVIARSQIARGLPPPKPRRDLARIRALQRLAKSCLYREERTDRGCGCSTCHARRGGGIDPTLVSLGDCVECVRVL